MTTRCAQSHALAMKTSGKDFTCWWKVLAIFSPDYDKCRYVTKLFSSFGANWQEDASQFRTLICSRDFQEYKGLDVFSFTWKINQSCACQDGARGHFWDWEAGRLIVAHLLNLQGRFGETEGHSSSIKKINWFHKSHDGSLGRNLQKEMPSSSSASQFATKETSILLSHLGGL